ncbi:hypothetical protein Nham_0852 [Nitrobacter hamburgensis X14]|uniref:Uncharacterized protein n=1 Tax=Nitrobacter hamburgensis (strain DSM 10229 / NCIMB 13809 / X14) TaxID=323097 RepID=Q1QPX6_NITHX|nr:hypothetical protein Nham_0852 [Nitrobacter hamburgensis X14]
MACVGRCHPLLRVNVITVLEIVVLARPKLLRSLAERSALGDFGEDGPGLEIRHMRHVSKLAPIADSYPKLGAREITGERSTDWRRSGNNLVPRRLRITRAQAM